MWKLLESLGIRRERSPELRSITARATAFRLHYDHAMLAAAELQEMIAASQRDLNDAFMRLRAAAPASPPSHLITEASESPVTEASETPPAEGGNGRASKRRTWSSAA